MQVQKRLALCLWMMLIALASPAMADEVKSFETVDGWGTVVDVSGGCAFGHEHGSFRITVPGIYHDLWPVSGKVNAPLVLQDVAGDFTVEVTVAHIDKAERDSVISGVGASSSFHAGTLVIWHDAKNFVRLDRTDMNKAGSAVTSCYFHVFKAGQRVVEAAPIVPDKPTRLRLQRRRNQVEAAYSQDEGRTWEAISSAHVDLPSNLKCGISALNNTNRPCEVRFAELRVAE